MAVLEMESVILRAERRRPGRVGAKRTKTWQVLGAAPTPARARAAFAGGAGDAVIGAGGDGEIDGLVDDEGDGLDRAGAADWGVGEV